MLIILPKFKEMFDFLELLEIKLFFFVTQCFLVISHAIKPLFLDIF
jgi:hypothetical protein